MWSSKPHEERHIDIACRRSTPNGIDDEVGQGLGEVNVLLEQRFSQPIAPPSLTWDKVERLILTAPTPEPVLPWWRTALQPGTLAMASAAAAIAVALMTSVPIFRTSVPALEGTVYARGGDGTLPSLPPPSDLMPQWDAAKAKERRVFFVDDTELSAHKSIQLTTTHDARKTAGPDGVAIIESHVEVPASGDAQELPVGAVLKGGNIKVMKIVQTNDLSQAELMDEVRKLNLKSDGELQYTISVSENNLEQRITAMQKLRALYGGDGFLPQVGGQMVITQDGQTKTIDITAKDLEQMSELDALMRRELERLNAEQAANSPEDGEATESSAPRTTGRQK